MSICTNEDEFIFIVMGQELPCTSRNVSRLATEHTTYSSKI